MRPEFLRPKEQVAIIAPSGRVFPEELKAGTKLIQEWELIPVSGQHLFADYYAGYHYAGTVEQRAEDLQKALDNPDIKAIWFARGGYGAVHLLEKINWNHFYQKPKWLIGYSDITVLHNHVNLQNIASIHGVTVKRLNTKYSCETFNTLKNMLFGEIKPYQTPHHPYNYLGEASGKLMGGNLSLIYSLMGSKTELKGDGCILFIEDWCENWYHLDRMLMNLKRCGLLNRIKGLIVGSFTRMDIENENLDFLMDFDPLSMQIIHNFMKEFKIPVCYGFPAGHIGDNRALMMGVEVHLNVTKDFTTLEFKTDE